MLPRPPRMPACFFGNCHLEWAEQNSSNDHRWFQTDKESLVAESLLNVACRPVNKVLLWGLKSTNVVTSSVVSLPTISWLAFELYEW
jgi:hypothetical protein